MRIAIDAMGGDNAPFEIVKGVDIAVNEFSDLDVLLIGDKAKIKECYKQLNKEIPNKITILHTDVEVTMEDDPMIVMKEKNNSSMAVGLKELKEGNIDAFVSAGSTGALHVASTLIVRKIKGVRRSAIAAILPFKTPVLLLDSGANPVVTEDILNQWAVVGSAYVNKMFGIEKPRVGLLNNGTEEHKGTPVAKEAYKILKENPEINFVGNIESKEIPNCPCDVLVTDGFTGNISLKLIEGMAKYMGSTLKSMYKANFFTKIAYILMKKQVKDFKKSFDTSEYGGAPLLGLNKPVIKAHGSSKAADIRGAIKQAIKYSESNIIDKVAETLQK